MENEWMTPELPVLIEDALALLDAGRDVPIALLIPIDQVIIATWPPPDGQEQWGHDDWLDDDGFDDEPEEPRLREEPCHFPWTNVFTRMAFEGAMRHLDSGRVMPLVQQLMVDTAIRNDRPSDGGAPYFIPDDWL